MVAFTFIIKKEGKSWNATRVASETEDEGEPITAEGDDTYRYGKAHPIERGKPPAATHRECMWAYQTFQGPITSRKLGTHPGYCACSLQRELYSKALEQASGGVRTSFSVVSPTSAVYQVTLILSRQWLGAALTEGMMLMPERVQDWHSGLSLNVDFNSVHGMTQLLQLHVWQEAIIYLESHYGKAAVLSSSLDCWCISYLQIQLFQD